MNVVILRVLFQDILLGLVSIIADICLVHWYLQAGDTWWAALTLAAWTLPGTLELLERTHCLCQGEISCCEWTWWAVFFGPVLFPVSLVMWNLFNICCDLENFLQHEVARFNVLSSLSLSKSCLQLGLQVTILMITWKRPDEADQHWPQLASVICSTLIIAKKVADHHYFEISGKNVKERTSFCQSVPRMFLNLFHIICRGYIIALLCSYLHFFSIIFLVTMVLTNFIVSRLILQTEVAKTVWTAFASVLLPVKFCSKDTVKEKRGQEIRNKFGLFYIQNTVTFVIIFGLAWIAANLLIAFGVIEFNSSNCPFFCSDEGWNRDYGMLGFNVSIVVIGSIYGLLVCLLEWRAMMKYEPVSRTLDIEMRAI